MQRLACTFLFTMLIVTSCAQSQKNPNVVLILTDDQGWGDLSLHGNPWLETPHLDGLAKSGTRFSNFYVSPLCAPTRASILTGRYHLKTGVVSVSKGLEVMHANETTLAELFKANGYRTGIFGKWHNGGHFPHRPNDQGFDEFFGFCAGHWSNYFDTHLEHNNTVVKTKGYITDVLTDAAIQFIDANKVGPFFCYIPFNAPHTPHQVPDGYFNKYKAKGLTDELASIYGMVENVDDNVGRVLAFLKANGLEENTVVVFLTDNGPNGVRYNGEMRGIKGSVHEGGVRVPFFIRWKDHIPSLKTIDTPAAHIDLYPTLTELCSLKPIPGKPIDGLNLGPLLMGTGSTDDRNIFTHVNYMQLPVTLNKGGFRNNQYRFVFEEGNAQVYDVRKDPQQQNDLANQNKQLTQQLHEHYENWFSMTAPSNTERPIVLSKKGVELPVYEAHLSPGIKFKEGHGWAHDWIEIWNSETDSLTWDIECQDAGYYSLELEYLCKEKDTGSVVRFSVGNETKDVVSSEAFYSTEIHSPDRVTRKEAYEMSEWKRLPVGTYKVSKGATTIKMKAIKVKNENVAEVKGIRLMFIGEK